MGETRVRFRLISEWVIAVALLGAALVAGSAVLLEFRAVRAVMPVSAREVVLPEPSAGVPSRAISVPLLLFADGSDVHVGDRATDVVARLGAEAAPPSVESGPSGERTMRYYTHAGKRFALLFQPSDRGAEPRVVAIYLQE